MREVNFSIPSANRASVGINTVLYDRRALDCTSTLPLINSLNNLAYLTTSSARIREILTVDGGIERLVCILKNGKTKDMMGMWKWSLAHQCVVNIGVRGSEARGSDSRGSENIRTRVVEADMVPVLATILDNYVQVQEKMKAKAEENDGKRGHHRVSSSKRSSIHERRDRHLLGSRGDRRRQPPPPIDTAGFRSSQQDPDANIEIQPSQPHSSRASRVVSPLRSEQHSRPRSEGRMQSTVPSSDEQQESDLAESSEESNYPTSHLVPPMSAGAVGEHHSEADTPTTPTATHHLSSTPTLRSPSPASILIRPPTPPEISRPGTAMDGRSTPVPDRSRSRQRGNESGNEVQNDTDMDDALMLEAVDAGPGLPAPEVTSDVGAETFNITHRSLDGSIIDPTNAPPNAPLALSPAQAPLFFAGQTTEQAAYQRLLLDQNNPQVTTLASVPRDEDVIMSLQLLAYVSKYTTLRTYFQNCHLVPKLKLGSDLQKIDDEVLADGEEDEEDDNDAEYCQPNDYNIFPLIEKFTERQYSHDMKYWAAVVMRNLCRKDKTRGDIRQCAYYKCGKWEEYARQFAKCRRCRQTKYCSKDCQKAAWVAHRHWCEPAHEREQTLGPPPPPPSMAVDG